jgi:hypothetical protein
MVTDGTGEKLKLIIRRLYCPKCKRLHHELPDCIVPYKRHTAETIEEIISGKSEGIACDFKTVRRIMTWWKAVGPYFRSIMGTLAEKYIIAMHDPPAFKEMVRAAVNTNNWIFADMICTRSASLSRAGAC